MLVCLLHLFGFFSWSKYNNLLISAGFLLFYAEEDASGSLSSNSPHEQTESDDSEKDNKQLLSPTSGSGEVAFIKEVPR